MMTIIELPITDTVIAVGDWSLKNGYHFFVWINVSYGTFGLMNYIGNKWDNTDAG